MIRRTTTSQRQPTDDAPVSPEARHGASPVRLAAFVKTHAPLLLITVVALVLRLLVWRWHEFYPLGGDETEYLEKALILLRERRYEELQFMRPPLYTLFLAGNIYLFDSLVQRLRLIQAIISTLTILPLYALTYELFRNRRIALVAALLAALSYTLAANATELLTETLFLAGLTLSLWLLVRAGLRSASGDVQGPGAGTPARVLTVALAGASVGALVLLRSVALPLIPLGALWLLLAGYRRQRTARRIWWPGMPAIRQALVFAVCAFALILPWTVRNYVTYGAPILVDTTGAENLWLDNNPHPGGYEAGREEVKQQLFALGDDRAARQQLATERGLESIAANPGWFASKAWTEAQRFFALQYFDDMRERRAIWVPPAEVWLRLLLGDALWLLMLLCGMAGIILHRVTSNELRVTNAESQKQLVTRNSLFVTPKLLFLPWLGYILLTGMLFHVELRYRLPVYPVLLPYAAWLLVAVWAGNVLRPWRVTRTVLAALACVALLTITLLHRPYHTEAWLLAGKHNALWQAERALDSGALAEAQQAAEEALQRDPQSALARVKLARVHLAAGERQAALAELDAARAVLPDHPYTHLLRGALLRAEGRDAEARAELTGYESASLEDLQHWAWNTFAPLTAPTAQLDLGGGLDLGYIRGFSAPEAAGFRWSSAESQIQLAPPQGAALVLELRLASGRHATAPQPSVTVLLDGREVGRIQPSADWSTYRLPVQFRPEQGILTLQSNTFRPRQYDPASPDNRALGVMVDSAALVTQ